MLTMMRLNSIMKWLYGIGAVVAVIILMGLFEKVHAQQLPKGWSPDYKSKPIICAPINQIIEIADTKKLIVIWSGVGIGISENIGTQRVDLFLAVNAISKEWMITEIGPDKDVGCMIGFGTGFGIDADNMKLFTERNS
jgi:hypothetical protein